MANDLKDLSQAIEEGKAPFRRLPVEYVPNLDDESPNPVYGISYWITPFDPDPDLIVEDR